MEKGSVSSMDTPMTAGEDRDISPCSAIARYPNSYLLPSQCQRDTAEGSCGQKGSRAVLAQAGGQKHCQKEERPLQCGQAAAALCDPIQLRCRMGRRAAKGPLGWSTAGGSSSEAGISPAAVTKPLAECGCTCEVWHNTGVAAKLGPQRSGKSMVEEESRISKQ